MKNQTSKTEYSCPAELPEQGLRGMRLENTAAVLAPPFEGDCSRDGYIQRIKTIDEKILRGKYRFYFVGDIHEEGPLTFEKFGRRRFFVRFNSDNPEHCRQIEKLCRSCGTMYVHSAYRFVANVNFDGMRELLLGYGGKIVWDVHGAVPEEISLNNNEPLAEIAAVFERELYARAALIVCVNRAMQEHLEKKYGKTEAGFITVPILSRRYGAAEKSAGARPALCGSEKPKILYSGGTQKWQNVPLMLELAEKTAEHYDFTFALVNPAELERFEGYAAAADKIHIVSFPPEKLEREYPKYQYGLLLRDDTAVNRVACPTKLAEYIRNGVVPVLKSENIGDFAALGLQYISLDRLESGNLPGEAERKCMAESNGKILQLIAEQYRKGLKELSKHI